MSASGLEAFITSGRVADIAIAVLVAEIVILSFFLRKRLRLRDFLPNAISGLALLAALRESLQPEPYWVIIAAALSLSLVAHASDLYLRSRPQ